MKTALSHSQLVKEFESADFILKTQLQIAKDFGQFTIDFSSDFLQTPLSMSDILMETEEKVAELMKEGEQRFLQFLYLVDIPEKDFLELTSDEKFISKMALLIVQREAYKIYLRKKYS